MTTTLETDAPKGMAVCVRSSTVRRIEVVSQMGGVLTLIIVMVTVLVAELPSESVAV